MKPTDFISETYLSIFRVVIQYNYCNTHWNLRSFGNWTSKSK